MHQLASQILPTLESLGIWAYWIIGLFSFLEGWWITGVVAPGTLVVDAGGVLVRMGHLDFVDLIWFVALGAILGGEASWHSGRWLGGRIRLPQSRTFQRAQDLVRRHGPLAVVIGRFLGPVAGLAGLAAALSGMRRRQFMIWNIVSGLVYAVAHLSLGYLAGDLIARLSPYLPRLMLPLGILAALILVTWWITRQVRRGLPALLAGLAAVRAWLEPRLAAWGPLQWLTARYPGLAGFVRRRLDPGQGRGLLTTAVAALVLYLAALFLDGALDLRLVSDTVALDQRVASLAHAYWTPGGLRAVGWITQAGHVPVATLVALGSVLGFLALGRRAAALGLAVAVVGNAVTVTLLKLLFGRARPELSYFLESSNSFPSGHAAISVALYSTLALMLWRERLIGPTLALVAGVGLAVGLGLTRIYLVVHYLSDVLNGWVVGGIWLVIGLGLAEGMRRDRPAPARGLRLAALAGMVISLCGAGWFALSHTKSPAEQMARAPLEAPAFTDVAALVRLPKEVVTLSGDEVPPVSLLVAGPGPEAIRAALLQAGWALVPQPSPASILGALRADLFDQRPQTGATAQPAFLEAQPAALTLRQAEAELLVRLWPLGVQAEGAQVTALALAPEGREADSLPADASRALCRTLVQAGQSVVQLGTQPVVGCGP